MKTDPLTRFWSHVQKSESCWSWTGATDGGYGFFQHQGTKRAHRWIFERLHGPIGKGLVVRHRCHNPNCVRPEHLELGTMKDNAQDRVRDGRWLQRTPRGEKHGLSKLTDAQVVSLRRLALSGSFTLRYLAKAYGIHPATVSDIKRGVHRP